MDLKVLVSHENNTCLVKPVLFFGATEVVCTSFIDIGDVYCLGAGLLIAMVEMYTNITILCIIVNLYCKYSRICII